MEKQLVLIATIYVFYIWALAIWNFRVRLNAIRSQKIPMGYFKTYEGKIEDKVIVMGRHYDNQFELPMLFLMVCLAHFFLKRADLLTVILGWGFLFFRLGHSYEHLGPNRIRVRVIWFASGWLMTGLLWAQFCYFALT